jgi:hypothetical protein
LAQRHQLNVVDGQPVTIYKVKVKVILCGSGMQTVKEDHHVLAGLAQVQQVLQEERSESLCEVRQFRRIVRRDDEVMTIRLTRHQIGNDFPRVVQRGQIIFRNSRRQRPNKQAFRVSRILTVEATIFGSCRKIILSPRFPTVAPLAESSNAIELLLEVKLFAKARKPITRQEAYILFLKEITLYYCLPVVRPGDLEFVPLGALRDAVPYVQFAVLMPVFQGVTTDKSNPFPA